MNEKIIKELIELRNQRKDLEARELLEETIKREPDNTDLLLRLAIINIYTPFADFDESIKYINQIFNYDPNNIEAALVLTYIKLNIGNMDEELLNKLTSLSSNNNEFQSMIEFAIAWYYRENNNNTMYENHLIKSIELYSRHAWNYINLGRLYIKQGKLIEGKKLVQKGLENIQIKYKDKIHCEDTTNIDQFLKEFYKGTHITNSNYESIEEDLMKS